ncbi:MAG TPA: M23 family metallopeptidase [Vicinamibacterales bacterium]|nr:M23 family metallopeptidase [Vicinamibacterales bacterium]HOQ59631.1 M23 family metallopeptidase [Vicinamibacterales bacterium]HPK70791.1 M23 family metallopeptidase [Vicinamibacterales bacterium]
MPTRPLLVIALVLLLLGAAAAFYFAGQEPGPLVRIEKPAAIGGGSVELDLIVDAIGGGLTRLDAAVEQEGRTLPLFSLASSGSATFTQETADRMRVKQTTPAGSLAGLRDGPARVVVTAARSVLFGLRTAESVTARDVAVRMTPPALAVVSTHHYVNLGGSEMVVYRVTPSDASSGVQVGDRFYPGFAAAGAAAAGARPADPSLRVAFFALLHDQDVTTPIRLVATDPAGNAAGAALDRRAFPSGFRRRRLEITDRFLLQVVPGILAATPGLQASAESPEARLDAYLKINRELRQANDAQIESISRGTAPERLWSGPFLRMGRAQAEAAFADHRTYVYGGREVDQQVHLGTDLASTRGAPIVAANTGRVAFAAYLGIYGNCVILDHGMGVQTLYGHLSSITVEVGDRVGRGEPIGRSGMTGLAGGDHLHFAVLVAGRPVNPVEWWDPHWIADRIDRKLAASGLSAR